MNIGDVDIVQLFLQELNKLKLILLSIDIGNISFFLEVTGFLLAAFDVFNTRLTNVINRAINVTFSTLCKADFIVVIFIALLILAMYLNEQYALKIFPPKLPPLIFSYAFPALISLSTIIITLFIMRVLLGKGSPVAGVGITVGAIGLFLEATQTYPSIGIFIWAGVLSSPMILQWLEIFLIKKERQKQYTFNKSKKIYFRPFSLNN